METDYKFIRKNKYIKMDRNGWHIDRRCLVPLLPVPPKNDIKWILERDKLPGKRRTMANYISKFWEDGKQIEMITEKKKMQ